MTLPDFSEWIVGEKFDQEEREWEKANREGEGHRKFANTVNALMPRSVIEFGCGTGWTAQYLTCKYYLGVDRNIRCLELASKRVPRFEFFHADIRDFGKDLHPPKQLALCISFLKHFGLHEWDEIFSKFMSFGEKWSVFTTQIWTEDKDNGVDYHHTYLSEDHLARCIQNAGHRIVSREIVGQDEHGAEWLIVTKNENHLRASKKNA